MDKKQNAQLAEQFINHTVGVSPGDKIWVEYLGPDTEALKDACVKQIESLGGKAHLFDNGSAAIHMRLDGATVADIQAIGAEKFALMKTMAGYIRICDDADEAKTALPESTQSLYKAAQKASLDYRVDNLRWLVVSTPSQAFADKVGMEYQAFCEYYNKVCLLDYSKMRQAAEPLADTMRDGHEVKITGAGTSLSFSISGIDAVICSGKKNIPDGEVFSCPERDSVNGTVSYGPSSYNGKHFNEISLVFSNGKIVDARSDNKEATRHLNAILDTDEGARYIGEFAVAFNPHILHPMGDILFDEKIAGSFHFTPGEAYEEADNGNRSVVHWDMVKIQRPDYGGGDIIIDGELIRRDGIFVPERLHGLNPENLI